MYSFKIDERIRFFEREWLNTIENRIGDKFRIKAVRYHSCPEKIMKMKGEVMLVDADAKIVPGEQEDVWVWNDSEKIHMKLRWNERLISGEKWYVYELWCKAATGDSEIKFSNLHHMRSTRKPIIPDGSVVECTYDGNRRTFSEKDMSWSKGMWNVIDKCDPETRVDDVKRIWTKVSLQREDISLTRIMRVYAENKRISEENIEWIDVL